MIDNRTPTNPNNYIWSTYFRRPTLEDRILQGLMFAAAGAIISLIWRAFSPGVRRAPSPLDNNNQGDLFKNW